MLADTGPLFAAFDRSDALHEQAQEEQTRLDREQKQVLVLYPILLECYSLVLRGLSIRAAHAWLGAVSSGARVVNPTSADYQQAVRIVRRYEDQALTLVDAVVAAASQRMALPVWTYDHHFDILHARVWPRWN